MSKKNISREEAIAILSALDLNDLKININQIIKVLNLYPDLFFKCQELGMKTNKQQIRLLVKKCYLITEFLPDEYKTKIDYVAYVVKGNPRLLKYCNQELLEDEEVIREVLGAKPYFKGKNPKNSEYFMRDLLRLVRKEKYEDFEFIKKILDILSNQAMEASYFNDDTHISDFGYYFDSYWLSRFEFFKYVMDKEMVKLMDYIYNYPQILDNEEASEYIFELVKTQKVYYKYVDFDKLSSSNTFVNLLKKELDEVNEKLVEVIDFEKLEKAKPLIYAILFDERIFGGYDGYAREKLLEIRQFDIKLAHKCEEIMVFNNDVEYNLSLNNGPIDFDIVNISNDSDLEKYIWNCPIEKRLSELLRFIQESDGSKLFRFKYLFTSQNVSSLFDNLSTDRLLEYVNLVDKYFPSCGWGMKYNESMFFSYINQDYLTDRERVIEVINGISKPETVFNYYFSLSENIKLDVEIALLALGKNHAVYNILRQRIRENEHIIAEFKSEKGAVKSPKEISDEIKDSKSKKEKEAKRILEEKLSNEEQEEVREFLSTNGYAPNLYVDPCTSEKISDSGQLVALIDYELSAKSKFHKSVESKYSKRFTKEAASSFDFLKHLSTSSNAMNIFKEVAYNYWELYRETIFIELPDNYDVEVVKKLLGLSIAPFNVPFELLNDKSSFLHFFESGYNGYGFETPKAKRSLTDYLDVILDYLDDNPDEQEIYNALKRHYFQKSLLGKVRISENNHTIKMLFLNEPGNSPYFRSVGDTASHLLDNEYFVEMYCEKVTELSKDKKITFLLKLDNKKLLSKFYGPLVRYLHENKSLGITLTKRYKKIIDEKPHLLRSTKDNKNSIKNKTAKSKKDVDDKNFVYVVDDYNGSYEVRNSKQLLKTNQYIIWYDSDSVERYGKVVEVNKERKKGNIGDTRITCVAEGSTQLNNVYYEIIDAYKKLVEIENFIEEYSEEKINLLNEIEKNNAIIRELRYAFFGEKFRIKREHQEELAIASSRLEYAEKVLSGAGNNRLKIDELFKFQVGKLIKDIKDHKIEQ